MNKKDIIFIHIPKTGGTTINTAMQGTYWQTTPDFNYRHIDGKSMVSNAGDIFRPSNIEKFKAYKIFSMFRDPVDRILSEYSFIKERRDFMNLLKPQPKSFEEYISNNQTSNGVVKFLLGHKMYSKVKLTEDDLEDVLIVIEEIPIYGGIFEEFGKSLAYFSSVTGIDWGKKIEVKRITFNRPRLKDISEETKQEIINRNLLDIKLYEFVKARFDAQTKGISPNVKFIADKYNHAIPYAYNFCFFEYCLDNKVFINQNLDFFKKMTHLLIKEKGLKDGRVFTRSWLKSFVNHLTDQFPNALVSKEINSIYKVKEDPLSQLENVAQRLDDLFSSTAKKELPSLKIKFEPRLVEIIKPSLTEKFGRMFG